MHAGAPRRWVFDVKSLAATPSIAAEAGDFGEDCLSEASSAAARFGEKRREAAGRGGGCSFLWLLFFGHTKESNSHVARKRPLTYLLPNYLTRQIFTKHNSYYHCTTISN